MARTKYEPKNAKFSNLAHTCAKLLIYPQIFKTRDLRFESTLVGDDQRSSIYDAEMGIDRIVYVEVEGLRAALKFTVQERFRKMNYAKWRDLTITEWNYSSDLPSELYKINAGLFLYGYFDETKLEFGETILVNTTDLLYQIALQEIDYKRERNRKNQTFLGFLFDELTPVFHVQKTEGIDQYFDLSKSLHVLHEKYKHVLTIGEVARIISILRINNANV